MLTTYRLSAVAERLPSFPAKCSDDKKRGHISGVVFGKQESCIFFLSLSISSCAAVSIHWSLSCLMLQHCSACPHAFSLLSLSPLNAVRLVFPAYWYAHSVTLSPSFSPSLLLSYSLTDAHRHEQNHLHFYLLSFTGTISCPVEKQLIPNKKNTSKCGIH